MTNQDQEVRGNLIDLEHADLVERLAKPGESILSQMTNGQAHLLHMAVGIAGEAGELLDCIKKHVIYQQELDKHNVVEELGDLMFYMQGIMNELKLNPSTVKRLNIDKLEIRYGKTYSDEAAKQRRDKEA